MRNAIRVLPVLLVAAFALQGTAQAATVTNNDADAHTLQITENGERSEVTVGAGQTVDICSSGCFLTLPSGDLIALEGPEAVTIVDGTASIN